MKYPKAYSLLPVIHVVPGGRCKIEYDVVIQDSQMVGSLTVRNLTQGQVMDLDEERKTEEDMEQIKDEHKAIELAT